jgi:hypothetical protein
MARQRLHGWTWIILLLCGCAPGEAPRRDAATAAAPSPQDISDAMGRSMPPVEDGGYFCAIVSDVRCVPAGRRGRLQCAFRESRGVRRTAVVERTGRTEWERMGHWRWVRGWRRCDILY